MEAFTNEVRHYLNQNPDPSQCPFSDHYRDAHLHNPAAYLTRTPELKTVAEEYRTPEDRMDDIRRLLQVASTDTRLIYRPAYLFLGEKQISGEQALAVIRNSLSMAHYYASLQAQHARTISIAARAPGTFRELYDYDNDGNITSLNFTSTFIRNKIHPLRAKGFGCSLLGVVLVSPHNGKRYNAFDLYWDALVVEADYRRQRIAAQTRS